MNSLKSLLWAIWMVPGLLATSDIPQEIDDATLKPLVAEWIGDLSSSSGAERAAAAKNLEAAGPRILAWLPDLNDVSDVAVRDSLRRLRVRLEEELARQSVGPSRVTYTGPLSLDAVLPIIQKQTENPLQMLSSETLRSISTDVNVDWSRTPFWSVLENIEQATRQRWLWSPEAEKFRLSSEKSHLAVSHDGPIRIVLEPSKLQPLNDGTGRSLLKCDAHIQVEPRLRPLFAKVAMSAWSGSVQGDKLEPWSPGANYELPFPDRTSEIVQTLTFLWPGRPPAAWSLTGAVKVHMAVGREELTFGGPELARGASLRRGTVVVGLRDVHFSRSDEGRLHARIRIVVNYDEGGPAFESHRVMLFHRSAWLTDRRGTQFPTKSFEINAEVDGGLAVEYLFTELPGSPVDYHFTYEAPTLLLDVPAKFHFADLPAPRS